MRTLVMTWAMVKRYGIELKRYAFNTLSMLVSFYLIFLILFLGIRSFAGNSPQFGEALPGMVIGFTVFYLVVYAYAELSWVLIAEAQQGTLEQLSMSPLGFGRVIVARIFAALAFRIVVMFALLVIMMATTIPAERALKTPMDGMTARRAGVVSSFNSLSESSRLSRRLTLP